jgi:hydroxymethylglutaryl-CoA reductase (NADPH)
MNLRKFASIDERRNAIEKELGISLKNIGNYSTSINRASINNCENMIGVVQIPIGIAGPIKINGSNFNGDFYIPLATTEGALVASVNRGIKAISLSGGANTFSHRVGQTRGPVFSVNSLAHQRKVFNWIIQKEEKLNEIAKTTSKHIDLVKIEIKGLSNYLFVRFYFNTHEAMGMNMVTIATQKMSEFVEKETHAKLISVAGNYDIDKKAAWLNFINNRGIKAWSEVILTKEVLKDILKTSAGKFFDVWLAKCMIGSAMSGSLGFNAQYANIIAGIYIATGQDPAHVVEGSMGITTAKILKNESLLVNVYLPALQLGIIGGGTGLDTQKEALDMLGVKGFGGVERFAEIIVATVLAGEISLLSSLSDNTLAQVHQKLGRGKE